MKNKLSLEKSWEINIYYVDKKEISFLSKVSIKDKEYRVSTRRMNTPYSDSGHTYYSTSDHHFITEKVFGIDHEFDLNTIVPKVNVYAVEFSFKE